MDCLHLHIWLPKMPCIRSGMKCHVLNRLHMLSPPTTVCNIYRAQRTNTFDVQTEGGVHSIYTHVPAFLTGVCHNNASIIQMVHFAGRCPPLYDVMMCQHQHKQWSTVLLIHPPYRVFTMPTCVHTHICMM